VKLILNRKGGILLLGLSLLPLFLTTIFGGVYFLNFLHLQSQVQKICFTEPRKTQNVVSERLKSLLSLNQLARQLKTAETTTRIALSVALRAIPYSAPVVARLKLQLAEIIRSQIALKIQQQTLISAASLSMQTALQSTSENLKSTFNHFGQNRNWLSVHSHVQTWPNGGLAVEAESSDRAPTYRLKANFETRQALVHSWHLTLKVRSWLSNWMDRSLVWNERCYSTIAKENNQWIVKSNLGKSSSSH
jgi:hypothetical protein